MRISEGDLILPALWVISENSGIATSSLIKKLEKIFRPTGEDAEILSGRSDTKFSQIVRNLVSHEKLVKLGYATYIKGETKRSGGVFHVTDQGVNYLQENHEIVDNLLLNGFPYTNVVGMMRKLGEAKKTGPQIELIDENLVIREGRRHKKTSIAYERSDAVRRAAFKHYQRDDGHIICEVCGFDFLAVYGERGKDYIEIHHEIPLYETNGEEREEILRDAIENVKPVCSNCHSIIHRKRDDPISVEKLKELVRQSRFKNQTNKPSETKIPKI